jgi:hypothetical protein
MALVHQGFEIAHPVRDHGIDLVIFSDAAGGLFSALPMQVKVHSTPALMIERKYDRFDGLIYAVVWDALAKDPRFFFLDHQEMMGLMPKSSLSAPF